MKCNDVAVCIKNNLIGVVAGLTAVMSLIFIILHITGVLPVPADVLEKLFALLAQAVTVGVAL